MNAYTYLASPYSHADKTVMEQRFVRACELAGQLMSRGELVFSPIAHTHPIAVRCDLPRGWQFWERYDRAMLAGAGRVLVATMPGWKESAGVAAEIRIAGELGIPVEFLEAE